MKRVYKSKRLVALLCCLVLMVGLLPITAFAETATHYVITVNYLDYRTSLPIAEPEVLGGPIPGQYYKAKGDNDVSLFTPLPVLEGCTPYGNVTIKGAVNPPALNTNPATYSLLMPTYLNIATASFEKDCTINVYFTVQQYVVRIAKPDGSLIGKGLSYPEDIFNDLSDLGISLPPGYALKGLYKDKNFQHEWLIGINPVVSNMTLYADLEVVDACTVNFITNGGSAVPSQTVTKYSTISKPVPDPVKPNFEFDAWYADAGCTIPFLFDYTWITVDTNIYANWIDHSAYTVTFVSNGGSAVPSQSVVVGQKVVEPKEPVRAGFKFDGWRIEPTLDTPWDFNSGTMPNFDIDLYAKWIEITHVVFFSTGSVDVPAPQWLTVQDGSLATRPPVDPVWAGYTFVGWYKDGAPYDFGTPVTSTFTLYAVWNANVYRVTFDSGGGSYTPYQNVIYGNTVVEPADPQWAGHTFLGWFVDSEADDPTHTTAWDFENRLIPPYDFNLYAHWTGVTYTVTFDSTGGSTVYPQTQNVLPLGFVTKPTDPVWPTDEYIFAGWYHDADLTDTFDFVHDQVTKNITIYAKWEKVRYYATVTYTVVQPLSYDGPPLPAPFPNESHPSKPFGEVFAAPIVGNVRNYLFDSEIDYYLDEVRVNGYNIPVGMFNPITAPIYLALLTDNFTKDLNISYQFHVEQFTVVFDCNGGTLYNDEVFYRRPDAGKPVVQPADPIRTGYSFVGWYEPGSNWGWDFDAPVIKPITLIAVWQPLPIEVNFYYQHGDVDPYYTTTVLYDELVPGQMDPTKVGHTFRHWAYWSNWNWEYVEWDFGKPLNEETLLPDDVNMMLGTTPPQLNLVALWEVNSYNLTLKDSLSSDVYYDDDRDYGVVIDWFFGWKNGTFLPTKPGYSFNYWYGSNSEYWTLPSTMPASDLTLTAYWNNLELTGVVFPQADAIGGSVGDFTATVKDTTTPKGIVLEDIQFEISNANLPDENHLWVSVFEDDNTTPKGNMTVRDLTESGNGLYTFPSVSTPMIGDTYINGQTITFIVYDGWTVAEGVEIGRFTVTVEIPVYITSIDGFYTNTTSLSPPDDGPLVYRNPALVDVDEWAYIGPSEVRWEHNEVSGLYITHSPGTLRIEVWQAGAQACPDIYGTGPDYQHDPIDLTSPVTYMIYNGFGKIAEVTVVPTFKVHIDPDSTNFPEWDEWLSYGDTVTEPVTPAKTYYIFNGWYMYNEVSGGYDPYDFSWPVTKDIQLKAGWIREFTVDFIDNAIGATLTPTATQTQPQANWIQEKVAANGYATSPIVDYNTNVWDFLGWYEDLNDDATKWEPWHQITRDLTLYAKFTLRKFTVTFYALDATPPFSTQVTVECGSTIDTQWPLPNPDRTYYTFAGWFVDPVNLNGQHWSNTPIYEDTILYAAWTANPGDALFVFLFDTGVVTTSAVNIPVGNTFPPIPLLYSVSPQFFPSDYTTDKYWFDGWYTDPACNAADKWDFATDTMPVGGVELYGKWVVNTFTVSFFVDPGVPYNDPDGVQTDVPYGEKFIQPTDPTKTGYDFDGWVTETGALLDSSNWNVLNWYTTDNHILTAQWVENVTAAIAALQATVDEAALYAADNPWLLADSVFMPALTAAVLLLAEIPPYAPTYFSDVMDSLATLQSFLP